MSKNLFKFAFVLLCFIASSVSVRAGEQFTETQSFDEGCFDWEVNYDGVAPEGWLYYSQNRTFNTVYATWSDKAAYDGEYYLGATDLYGNFASPIVYTKGFELKAGSEFTVSFKYYTPGKGKTPVAKNITTYVRACSAQNAESVVAELGSFCTYSTDWEDAQVTFTPETDGVYYIQLQAVPSFKSQTCGNAYYDAFEFEGEHPDAAPAGIVIDETQSFDEGCYDWNAYDGVAPEGWLYYSQNRTFNTVYATWSDKAAYDGEYYLGATDLYGNFASPIVYTKGFAIKGGTTFTMTFKYYTPGKGKTPVAKNITTYVRACSAQNAESVVAELASFCTYSTDWEDAEVTFTPEKDGIYYFQLQAVPSFKSQTCGNAYYDAFTFEGTGCEFVPAPDPISEYPAVESFEEELVGWTLPACDRPFAVFNYQDCGLTTVPDGENILFVSETRNTYDAAPVAVTNGYVMTAGTSYRVTFYYRAPGAGNAVQVVNTSVSVGTAADACDLVIGTVNGVVADWTKQTFKFTPTEDGTYYFQIKSEPQTANSGNVAIDAFAVEVLPASVSTYPAEEGFEGALAGWYLAPADRPFAVFAGTDCGTQAPEGDNILFTSEVSSAFTAPVAVSNGFVMEAGKTYRVSFAYYAPAGAQDARVATTTLKVGSEWDACNQLLGTITGKVAAWTTYTYFFTPEAAGTYYFQLATTAELTSCGGVGIDAFTVEAAPAVVTEFPAEESFEDGLAGWTLGLADRRFAISNAEDSGLASVADGEYALIVPETGNTYDVAPKATTNGYALRAGQAYTVEFRYLAAGGTPATVRFVKTTVKAGTDINNCTELLGEINAAVADWTKEAFVFTPATDGVYYFEIEAAAQSTACGLVGLDLFKVKEFNPITEIPAVESFEDELVDWTFSEGERYFAVYSSTDAGVEAYDGDYVLILPETSPAFGAPYVVTNGYALNAGQKYEVSFKYLAPGNGARKNTITVKAGTDAEACTTEVLAIEETAAEWAKAKFTFAPEADGYYFFQIQATANLASAGLVALDEFVVDNYIEPISEFPAEESFEDELVGWILSEGERFFAVYSAADAGLAAAADGENVLVLPETSPAFGAPYVVTNGYALTAGQKYEVSFKYLAPGNDVRKNTLTVSVGNDNEACNTEVLTIEETAADWTKAKFTFAPEADGVYYFQVKATANLASAGLVALDQFVVAEYVEPISEYPAVESFEDELVGWTIAATERQFAVYSAEDAGVAAADGDYVLIVPETSSAFAAPTAVTNGYVMTAGQQYDLSFKYLAPGNGPRKNTTTVKVGTDAEACATELVKIEEVAADWTKVKFTFTPEADGVYYFEIQSVANLTSAGLVAIDAFTVAEYVAPISEYPAVESFEDELLGWSFSNTARQFAVYSAEDAGLQGAPDGENVLVLPETSPAFGEPAAYTNGYVMQAGEVYEITFQYYAPGFGGVAARYNTTTLSVGTDPEECNLALGNLQGVFNEWEEQAFWFSPEEDGVYYFEIKAAANVPSSGMVAIDQFVVAELVDPISEYPAVESFEDELVGWTIADTERQFAVYSAADAGLAAAADGDYVLIVPETSSAFAAPTAVTNGYEMVAGQQYDLSFKYLAPGNGVRKNTTTVKVGTDNEACDTELVKIEEVAADWTKVKFTFTPEADGVYYFEFQSVANLPSAGLVAIDALTVAEHIAPISEYPAVESFEDELVGWSFSDTARYFAVASAQDAGLAAAPDGENVLVLPETSPAFGEPAAYTNGYVMEAGELYEITFQYYAPGNGAPSVRYNTTTVSVGTDPEECTLALGNLTGIFDQWEETAFWFCPEEDGVYYFEIKSAANVPSSGMVAIDLFSVDKLFEETVYLAGQCNGWNPADDAYKFARQDDGTYTLDVEGTVGEFKLTNGSWDVNYGSNGSAIVAGQPYALVQGGGNLNINLVDPHFVLDVETWTLTVTGEEVPVEVPEHVYVIGTLSVGNWAPAKGVELTRQEGTSTFKVENLEIVSASSDNALGYFSFITTCDSDWNVVNASDRFGAASNNERILVPGTTSMVCYQGGVNAGSAYSWSIEAGKYDITIDFEAMTVNVIESESGVEGIEVINSDARYFNLQGVEVAAPANGVFIEVLGNQVRKVYVK